MTDIFHSFPINAAPEHVFEAISTPGGMDKWWTKSASGNAAIGDLWNLHFEPDYNWKAIVSKFSENEVFELTMQLSDEDWEGSRVGFQLTEKSGKTDVQFYHIGWKENNAHYRNSNYCWAMYLRILKRYLEFNEFVPYSRRLDV